MDLNKKARWLPIVSTSLLSPGWLQASYHFNLDVPGKRIRIVESEKCEFWHAESWALDSRLQLKESRIPLMFAIWIQVPLTKNPESTEWDPESKTVLDFFTWGDIITWGARHWKRSHTCALCSSSSVGCVSSIKDSPLSMFWEIFDLFPEAWFPPFLLRLLTILPVVKQ